MKTLRQWWSACLWLVLGLPALALAQVEEAPDVLVKRVSDEVLQILRTDEGLKQGDSQNAVALVEKVVLPHFNFRRMTSLAVGRDWRSATPEQQKRLIDAFYSMLVRTYSNALTQYRDQTIAFKPVRMAPDEKVVRVQSEIRQPGAQPITVDYTLERGADGWKVFDITVAGVSLVTNYRNTFAQEISKSGIDGLIQALETQSPTLEAAAPGRS